MKISKNSWHYKIATDSNFGMSEWNISNSLCVYFWQVVKGITLALFMAVIISVILLLMVVFPLIIAVNGVVLMNSPTSLVALIGCCLWVVVFAFVFIEVILPKIKAKFPRKESKSKEPNIVIEYIKAKKVKVCPVIEFEEK